jgi:hypothetical protein
MGETTDAAAAATDADDLTRPRFRGCVFCYTAEMVAYGVRKARH